MDLSDSPATPDPEGLVGPDGADPPTLSPVAAKHRKDGGRKRSGLREGMHRTPYTLHFKYQVALDFARFANLKVQGLCSNPLARTSSLYNGLSTSNIWKWHN